MPFQLLQRMTLKQRILGLMLLLGTIPLACFASTFYSMWRSQEVENAFSVAHRGAISLTEVNAQAYAVVMESRGIYMSSTWAEAKPYADGLERSLVKMNDIVTRWKRDTAIAGEVAAIEKLEASIHQFTQLRREIVRRAQTGDLAGARTIGDNEANRATRKAMNALISDLAERYKAHEASAEKMKDDLERFNMLTLIALAVIAVIVGAISARSLQRTVIIVFNRMRIVMGELAAGNLNVEFDGADRQDEIGDFARAFHKFKSDAQRKEAMEAEARAQARQIEAERERVAAEERANAQRQAEAMAAFAAALGRLAEGDLEIQIADHLAPEFDDLKAAFNGSVSRLRDAMQRVAENTTTIAGSTNEIASAADDLSRRTEKQAATLEETSAALAEVTNTVRKTSEGASSAQELANTTKANADKAATIVRDAIAAMGGIEKSSQQISKIIGVIDEIAFQTNLLALNAGVEAARAGESGRGFAVVASEVRALAQRSATAAKEIKDLITASSQQVEKGVSLVGGTGRSLDEIQAQVGRITVIIDEIATAARSEAASLSQINTAVTEMDQATQQNAAMVEETTAAGRALSDMTTELSAIVSHFKTGRRTGPASAEAVPARPPERKSSRPTPARATARPAPRPGNLAVKTEPAAQDASWEEF
jgi:methyl-accepting chemotaxis protein